MRTVPALRVQQQAAGQSEDQELVERLADTLVRLLKDGRKGIKVPGVDPEEIEALDLLARPFPAYLCRPSVSVAARSTEAYFVLWAHTPKGMRKLSKWESQEPARISFHLEVPRFLREVLTLRTPLNVVCRKRAFHLLSTEQRIAFAFLRSPERTLTEEEIYNAAGFRGSRIRVFEDFKGETALVGFQGYLGINIDMAVIGYFGGMPHFFLPLGHENKVFRDLWARNKQTDGFLFDSDHELENADPSSFVPRVSEVWSFGGVPF